MSINISSSSEATPNTLTLNPLTEWRFELQRAKTTLSVRLTHGTAELFGTELAKGQEYEFRGPRAAAIHTWHGAVLEYTATSTSTSTALQQKQILSEYVAEETPMHVYANLHFGLEAMVAAQQPPRVMVMGPRDSGKTSLCKLLAAYANKSGQRFPVVVNLNPLEAAYAAPGAVSAAVMSDIIDIEQGWGSSAITGPVLLHTKKPLAYWFGLESHATNTNYYTHVAGQLAQAIDERTAADEKVRRSGLIIDTPPDLGGDRIERLVDLFSVNVLVVIVGQERLYSDMIKQFKGWDGLTVVKVPKSGGCVDREPVYRRAVTAAQINEYFYGMPKQMLAPYTVTVDYSKIVIYRVAEDVEGSISTSTLLVDGESKKTESSAQGNSQWLVKLEPSSIVQNCVMAMLNAEPDTDPSILVNTEVLGFVHVVEADDNKNTMRVRMPVHGQLPRRPFVIGDFRYHE